MAENYTVLTNKKTGEAANAATFNLRYQELDDAIEGMKAGTAALSASEILSLASGQHDHEDAAGGGLLTLDALASTGADASDLLTADGAGVVGWVPKDLPTTYREGLDLLRVGNDTLVVTPGSAIIRETVVNKSTLTVLQPSVGDAWVNGYSRETTSQWLWVYMNPDGVIKLHDVAPNYTAPYAENHLCTLRIDQAGWDGTAGNGLGGATLINYDDGVGGNPDGVENILSGAFALVYTTSAYELGRGKGSGAAGSKNNQSVMTIQSVDVDAKNISQAPGFHNIALNDNDYLLVVENGDLDYRLIDGEWWLALGAIWNDASGHLSRQRMSHVDVVDINEGADYALTSSTMVAVDSTDLNLQIISRGREMVVGFNGTVYTSAASQGIYFDVMMDGLMLGSGYGALTGDGLAMIWTVTGLNFIWNLNFKRRANFPLYVAPYPGTHTFTLMWRRQGASSVALYAGSGTANVDVHPQFWVRERRNQ